MVDFTFTANGLDLAPFVERDHYSTGLLPVYTRKITTMDGVDHMALIRHRGTVSASLNPQTAETTARICLALLHAPVQVQYHCLQRNQDVAAYMVCSDLTAQHLSRCLARGQKWNDLGEIELEEL